jgi:hypothetical protein
MATGELQMITALLMKDGRYEESVAILLFSDMQLIQGCFELLQKHLSAKKYKKDLMPGELSFVQLQMIVLKKSKMSP